MEKIHMTVRFKLMPLKVELADESVACGIARAIESLPAPVQELIERVSVRLDVD